MALWRWLISLFRSPPTRDPAEAYYNNDGPRRRAADAASADNAHKAGMNHGGGGP